MTNTALYAAAGIAALVIASAVFLYLGRKLGAKREVERLLRSKSTAEETARRITSDAEREAESLRKTALLSGKEELIKLRETWETEARGRREEIEKEERKVGDREGILNRKYDLLEQRERDTTRRSDDLVKREETLGEREKEVDRLLAEERRRLEQLAGITAADAKAELIHRMEEEAHADAANRIREIRETAKRNAEREAKKIIALAIQRIAAEQSVEATVSAVSLPNDEMKGRIIGREGRNIRAFELATASTSSSTTLPTRSSSPASIPFAARSRGSRSRSSSPTAASIRDASRKSSTSRRKK